MIAVLVLVLVVLPVLVVLLRGGDRPRLLGWFGRLPGDVRIERPGFRLYVPITSMLILSLFASLLLGGIGPLLALVGGAFSSLGRLPGDVVIRREGFVLVAPFTSMAIVSLVLTLLLNAFRAWSRRRDEDREP